MSNNDGNIIKRTSQYIDNQSFDETTGLKMAEIAGTPDGTNVYRAQVDSTGALKVTNSGSSSGLTDTELRATPVPVSGTVTANTGLTQPTTPTDTQPVSAVSLPLPTGASTSAAQTTAQASLTSIDTNISLKNAPGKLRYTKIISASDTITPTTGKAIKVIKVQVVPSSDNTSAVQIYIHFATSAQDIFNGYAGGGYGIFAGNTNEVLTITQTGTGNVQVLVDYNEV